MTSINIGFRVEGIEIVDFVQRADELGFESVWLPEASTFEPGLCLAAAAAKSSRIKLGTSVTVVPYYHPWILARRVVTLDHISGGRYIFGVGVGWRPPEFEVAGVPFNARGAYTDEAVGIIRTILTEGNIHHEGRFFKIPELVGEFPRPIQKPYPPIMIGGGVSAIHRERPAWPGARRADPEAALKRTARYGDIYAPPPFNDLPAYQYAYEQVLKYAAEEGRKMPERFMTVTLSPVNIQSTVDEALADIRTRDERMGKWWKGVYRSTGNPSPEERQKFGAVGPPERCIERIKELARVPGLQRVIVDFVSTDQSEQLERFHQEVAPHI
ncbi:MAG: LLM class flavin-dependent oxidoreductase [Chloroflexi bacterium]|nr:LLM class flavin-dependent oxidoreductase [Chloroflexota bacterium]